MGGTPLGLPGQRSIPMPSMNLASAGLGASAANPMQQRSGTSTPAVPGLGVNPSMRGPPNPYGGSAIPADLLSLLAKGGVLPMTHPQTLTNARC